MSEVSPGDGALLCATWCKQWGIFNFLIETRFSGFDADARSVFLSLVRRRDTKHAKQFLRCAISPFKEGKPKKFSREVCERGAKLCVDFFSPRERILQLLKAYHLGDDVDLLLLSYVTLPDSELQKMFATAFGTQGKEEEVKRVQDELEELFFSEVP